MKHILSHSIRNIAGISPSGLVAIRNIMVLPSHERLWRYCKNYRKGFYTGMCRMNCANWRYEIFGTRGGEGSLKISLYIIVHSQHLCLVFVAGLCNICFKHNASSSGSLWQTDNLFLEIFYGFRWTFMIL